MRFLVTGGAGFIGSAVVRYLLDNTDHEVGIIDKMGYASDLRNFNRFHPRLRIWEFDLKESYVTMEIVRNFDPHYIMHLAAESHVDNSIDSPAVFIESNVTGTFNLLEAARHYAPSLIKFHHISTDEVYGDLADRDEANALFKEDDKYDPSSPYSASKAASDHLVSAWHRTYGLPVVITNCSNNYGPYHHPEKLIPKVITNALQGKKIPLYGNGDQIRDWLYVEDHAEALYTVVTQGVVGEKYNIGGHNEHTNEVVIHTILNTLNIDFWDIVERVVDRPGHDLRYAIDASKIRNELNWKPKETFTTGIEKTVEWYLQNEKWWKPKV